MADYNDFMSMGTTYEFSKGPKSLYYAKGDQDLFALVLNVPQQDDDDEWGGTERIALERIADVIGTLQEYVLDPGGGGNGLLDRVSALEVVVNTTAPSVAVGNITVNGATDTITIGSDALLDADTLQLGGTGAFKVDEFSANRYDVTFKTNAIRIFDDGVAPTVTIVVGTSSYIFGATSFSVPEVTISGDITASGDVNGTNGVFSGDIAANEIMCASLVGTALVTGTATICGSLTTRDLAPDSSLSRNIGIPGNRYKGLAAEDINLGITSTPTCTIDGATGGIVTSGNLDANQIQCTSLIGTSLQAGSATICGTLTTQALVPDSNTIRNIGLPGNRYLGIAAEDLNLGTSGTPSVTIDGSTGAITTSGDIAANDISVSTASIGTLIAGGATICGNLIPGLGTSDLGESGSRWDVLYTVNASITGDVNVTGNISSISTGDIRSVAYTSYTSTITGWTTGSATIYYKKVGKTVTVHFDISGTSNSSSAAITLPIAADATKVNRYVIPTHRVDDTTEGGGMGILRPSISATTLNLYPGWDTAGAWGTAVAKDIQGTIIYEAA